MGRQFSNALQIRGSDTQFTFDDAQILDHVRTYILSSDRVLNLFAGKNVVVPWEIRIDSNPDMNRLDLVMDAESFLIRAMVWDLMFDVIIYDPPWNERKSKEFYNGHYVGKFTKLKDNIVSLLNEGGKIISLGYEIDNFGKGRGMEQIDLLTVNPSGEKRPYHVTVERKVKA